MEKIWGGLEMVPIFAPGGLDSRFQQQRLALLAKVTRKGSHGLQGVEENSRKTEVQGKVTERQGGARGWMEERGEMETTIHQVSPTIPYPCPVFTHC